MIYRRLLLSSLRRVKMLALAACLVVLAGQEIARAATIGLGDVTTTLRPTFFVDDATNGGGDTSVITQPSSGYYNRSFAGLLNTNQGLTPITLTGFGFSPNPNLPDNTATTLTVTFTYLGADEAVGGGDDVLIGSAAGSYSLTVGGEYVFIFDTPLTATLNITGVRFLIQVAPSNATNNGKVRFKTGALTYEAGTGAKFSVSGSAPPLRLNLAKYQAVATDSVNGQQLATYLTDGVVGNDNRWQSNGAAPHWAQVTFPYPVQVGSAQVFSGVDDGSAMTSFKLQYLNNSTWVDVPGAAVTGNTNVERNLVFPTPVTASAFRLYDSVDATVNVKELALYAPNGVTGYPIGTDVTLNLAAERPALATTANTTGNFALLAVDGRVNKKSMWQTSVVGSNTLEIDLRVSTKIGSAHLYSGYPGALPLDTFVLRYWDGAAWQDIPGSSVTGNTTAALVIPFTSSVTTSKVQLVFTNATTSSVQELGIFPANNNGGYPIGTDVTGAPASTAKYDDFNDAYYNITNPTANRFITVGNGQPGLSQPGATTAQGQYQVLLNIGAGTYRLCNRATGACLSGAQLATTPGGLLVDAPYSALPDQDWILQPLDATNFYLINQWSGLALDTQGGSTAVGTPLVQNVSTGAPSQRWQFVSSAHYPKKGVGGSSQSSTFKANWVYNWALATSASLPSDTIYQPMQWGNFNWTAATPSASTWKLYNTWRTTARSLHLLGFNEPDHTDQANMTVADAVTLWPRLQAMDLPLVAPCPADMTGGWLSSFYTQSTSLGYRVDYTAKHTYESPNGGSADNLINGLNTGYTTWGRPMWLTEFSFVDWGANQSWSEEDNYNCLAEFLWRAENISWLKKYALFVFTADANNPMAANPWTTPPNTTPSTAAPRSNSYDTTGALTPFGELYAAWDNIATVGTNKPYFIHNKNTRKRLTNTLAATPNGSSIRVNDSSTQWTLVSSPTSGQYYIVSSRDGRRLSYINAGAVNFVAANTTGTAVQWKLTENQYGWFYLDHPATSKRLQLAYNNTTSAATYTMAATTTTSDAVQWRFIVPLATPTWTGASGTSWTTASNWAPNKLPTSFDGVNFDSSSAANLATVLNQDFDIFGLTLTTPSGPVSIGGTSILTVLSNGIDLSAASQNLTITAPLVLGGTQNWNVTSGRTLSANGGVSGSAALTVMGAGKVSVGGAGTYTGDTTIAVGSTLQLGASNVLPNSAGFGNMIVNGTLDLNGFAETINGLSGTGLVDNTSSSAGVLTIGGNDVAITVGGIFQNTSGTLALAKIGSGSLVLSGANTHSGGFTNNGTGIVQPQNNAAFGSGPVVMNNGSLYLVGTSYTFTNPLTLNGAILRISGFNRTLSWTGPVSITGDSVLSAEGGTASMTLSGGLNMNNGGYTLTSSASATTNTISAPISGLSGTIMVTSGTLNLSAANSFGGNFRSSAGGLLKLGNANAMQSATLDMNAADAGSVSLNNLNATLGALTGSRNLALGSGAVSIGNNNLSTTYDGVLSGTGSLTKIGNGTLTLSNTNNYSGATAINGGTLALGISNVVPASAMIIGNAILDAATFTDTVGTLKMSGSAKINLGAGAALVFSNSSAVNWTGGTLSITGTFVSGSSLRFGTTSAGLTPTQLGLITATGFSSFALNASGFLTANAVGINTAPTISDIANQSVPSGGTTGALSFTVGDAETAASSLIVAGSSSNTSLVPHANIVFGGSGANRTVTVTPVSGLSGTATITVTVADVGSLTATDTFVITITDNYLSWATANGVTGGVNGDSDNDGVQNLVEYALVNGGERGAVSGNTITFTKRGAPYASEVSYIIETSESLADGSWTDAVTQAPGDPAPTISYTFTPGTPAKSFARLKVTQQ